MKIQVKSDTHNEFYFHTSRAVDPQVRNMDYISKDADVIVLAGDIATPETARSTVHQYSDAGKPVIYVAGNHDHWGRSVPEAREERKKLFEGTNIIELDNSFHIVDDTVFIGGTLWTNLSNPLKANIARFSKDFYVIKEMTPEKWNRMHLDTFHYIYHACLNSNFRDLKKVVVTHYIPTERFTPERFKGDEGNCIFMSNCEEIMELEKDEAPILWVHGHTHDSLDNTINNTRIVCNPYGYHGYEVNPYFDPELIIEI